MICFISSEAMMLLELAHSFGTCFGNDFEASYIMFNNKLFCLIKSLLDCSTGVFPSVGQLGCSLTVRLNLLIGSLLDVSFVRFD